MNVLTESDITNILMCELCHEKYGLYDEPKMIPCGLTICGQCEKKMDKQMINKETRSFKCLDDSCEDEHSKPKKGFPINKAVLSLLTTPLKEVYRGEDIETIQQSLKNIQNILNEITFDVENSDFKLKEFCTELRTQVQLSTEMKINQINEMSDLLLKEIDDYETECIRMRNYNKITEIISNDFYKEIKTFLEEKYNYLKRLNKIDEKTIKESINKANEYKEELEKEKENILSLIFDFKKLKFEINDKKVEKHFIGNLRFLNVSYKSYERNFVHKIQIRKEAEEEQAKVDAEIAKNQQNDRRNQQMGQKGGPGQRGAAGQYGGQNSMMKSSSMDSEAFNLRGQKQTNINMVKKITDVKQITKSNNNSDLLLGPGGGGGGFAWNKAAVPKQSTTDQPSTLTSSASFSVHQSSSYSSKISDDFERRTNLSSGGSISTSSSNATQGLSAVNKLNKQHSTEMTTRSSMDSTRGLSYKQYRQVQSVKKMDSGSSSSNLVRSETSSQASSRETSVSRPSIGSRDSSRTRYLDSDTTSKQTRRYTSDEIDRKVTSCLEEYIRNKDIIEALKDCEEFKPVDSSQYAEFIELFINKVLERSDSSRNALGVLFFNVIKEKKIDIIHFTNAFKNVLEMAEDMAIDVPKIATYLSQIIAPIFQKDFTVEFLSDFCEPIKSNAICAELISEILHNASNRIGHSTVVEIFKKSKLDIHDFLKGVDNSVEFIKSNNLTWALGNRERTQSASVSSESYERKLFLILQHTNLPNETIFDKIETEFGEIDCQSKGFIRALVTAVCRSCLDAQNKLDPVLFRNRWPVLTKFINRDEDYELEALFAIQALDHKMQHQPAFIRVLFDMFYDEDIISESVFWKWNQEAREEGHAISALSLKGFFDWLSEPDLN